MELSPQLLRKIPPGAQSDKAWKILIVDDHPMFRHGIATLLRETDDLRVCAEASNFSQALDRARQHKPDFALLDISMPGINGLELVKCLRAEHPNMRMLVLSMQDEAVYAGRAIRAGAIGFMSKDAPYEELLKSIYAGLDGQLILSADLSAQLLGVALKTEIPESHPQFDSLSAREVEILRCYGEGLDTPQICERLEIGSKTVETYRTRIKDKLGLEDFADLRRFAVEWASASEESARG